MLVNPVNLKDEIETGEAFSAYQSYVKYVKAIRR